MHIELDRRGFLKTTGTVFVLAIDLGQQKIFATPSGQHQLELGAYFYVTVEGQFFFICDKTEMGQDVMTSLATIFAEYLDIDPSKMEVVHAPVAAVYKNKEMQMQITGGSTSVRTSFDTLARAGAGIRQALVDEAAKTWKVRNIACQTDNGIVTHPASGKSMSYGDIFAKTPSLEIDEDLEVPRPKQFKWIGKNIGRLDARSKCTGQASFGADMHVDNAVSALVRRSPVFGGKIASVDTSKAVKSPGVIGIHTIKSGIGIVADKFWQAKKAANLVDVKWDQGKLGNLETSSIFKSMNEAAENEEGENITQIGDAESIFQKASKVIEVAFEVPYLAHAPMEPQNAIAHVQEDRCDIWAPTQSPGMAQQLAVEMTGLDRDQIFVHTSFLGGGFGRRIKQDFVAEAIELAMIAKRPVRVQWTREDDMRHSIYRPCYLHKLKAGLGRDNQPVAWQHKIVGPSILEDFLPDGMTTVLPEWFPERFGKWLGGTAAGFMASNDETSCEGAAEIPYKIANFRVDYIKKNPGIPIGFWRSVGHSHTAFAVESFVDELAYAAKIDPLEFRIRLLPENSKWLRLLALAAEKADWGKPKSGNFQGLAMHRSFHSDVVQIAEISKSENDWHVEKVTCVVDCGLAVNPRGVHAQVESAIAFGLSAALYGQISITGGRVKEGNFDTYPVLRANEMPKINVFIADGGTEPTGMGEPGLPPIAPAIANALFNATGSRHRSLPLKPIQGT